MTPLVESVIFYNQDKFCTARYLSALCLFAIVEIPRARDLEKLDPWRQNSIVHNNVSFGSVCYFVYARQ